MKVFNRKENKEKRKNLRRNQTEAEKSLWSKLRDKQLSKFKFFRQYGVEHYIVDFYCPASKLAVELDGGQHYSAEGKEYDAEREKIMKALGIQVIRFSNTDVLSNIDEVIRQIESTLRLAHHPTLFSLQAELPQPLFN